MERLHPRDMQSVAARAAMATSTSAVPSDSLLRRGVRIARSMMISPRCVNSQNVNTCEKPSMSTNDTLGYMVAAGVVAFIMALGVLFMLHLRRNRQEAAEFSNDRHNNADYGLDDIPGGKGGMGGGYMQPPAKTKQRRLSAAELTQLSNPFGHGAEIADSDKVAASHKENPPKYPDAVKM